MPFSRGDRVRCIDPQAGLARGTIYTVSSVSYDDLEDIHFCMVEGETRSYFQRRFELVDQPPAPVGEEVTVYLITAYRNETTIHTTHPSPEAANSWIRSAENLNYTILKKQKITFNL